jgi:hypothetical protein
MGVPNPTKSKGASKLLSVQFSRAYCFKYGLRILMWSRGGEQEPGLQVGEQK